MGHHQPKQHDAAHAEAKEGDGSKDGIEVRLHQAGARLQHIAGPMVQIAPCLRDALILNTHLELSRLGSVTKLMRGR